jgi:catechol 2,3-dioxygenase-like lactoylglutathione lyase family enzyme
MIECLVPILRVADLAVSRRYYLDILGFTADWDAGRMISVSRDGNPIMICEGAQGQPGTWLWVGVEDAQALFGEFNATGACVRSLPQNFEWAYEFQIEDPDGHVLRFGSDPKPAPKVASSRHDRRGTSEPSVEFICNGSRSIQLTVAYSSCRAHDRPVAAALGIKCRPPPARN